MVRTIAFFEIEKWEADYLKKSLPKNYKLLFFREKLGKKHIPKLKRVEAISSFINSKFTPEILSQLPSLKFITTRSTGYDHVDLTYCAEHGIKVSNVPYYGENTVAEHAMALILALARRIVGGVARTRSGHFNYDNLRGFDLKGKTLGIVGLGSIGKHVAMMAQGFDMKIIAYDPFKDAKFAKKYKIKYVQLPTLLKQADVVSLHVPYMDATHHIINKKNIKLMKKEAILVNTSRGGLIETDALLWMLRRNKLRGVGLDVMEEENYLKTGDEMLAKQLIHDELKPSQIRTLLEDHLLLKFDNVIMTPHNAFNSKEALMRILDTTIGNLKSYMKNGRASNQVKKKG